MSIRRGEGGRQELRNHARRHPDEPPEQDRSRADPRQPPGDDVLGTARQQLGDVLSTAGFVDGFDESVGQFPAPRQAQNPIRRNTITSRRGLDDGTERAVRHGESDRRRERTSA
jgi:hypothetical protein